MRSEPALEFANDVGKKHVAPKPHASIHQRFHRAKSGSIARLHVGNTDTVDEALIGMPSPWVNGPAACHRIRVEMAVKGEAAAAALPTPPSDRIVPFILNVV